MKEQGWTHVRLPAEAEGARTIITFPRSGKTIERRENQNSIVTYPDGKRTRSMAAEFSGRSVKVRSN